MIKIYTFGDWDIRKNGRSILEPKGSQQRLLGLLKYLLTFEGKKITPERIYEDLLMDSICDDPRNIVRTNISRLRTLFEGYDFYSIEYIAGYYVLNLRENCILDFRKFENLIEEGSSLMNVDPINAIVLLKRGIASYQGEYLPELYSENWIIGVRNRYRRLYLKGLYNYISLLKRQGDYNGIIEVAEKAIQYEPYEEMLNAYFIEALVELGQRGYALSHYEYYTAKVHNDLKMSPSNHIKELYNIIQDHNYVRKDESGEDGLSMEDFFKRDCKCDGEEFCNVEHYNSLPVGGDTVDIPSDVKGNYIMFITLEGNMDSEVGDLDLWEGMEIINRTLQSQLRSTDGFFQCRKGTMMVIFSDVNTEILLMISDRIKEEFKKEVKRGDIFLTTEFKPM